MQSFNGLAGTAPLFPVVADRSERFLVTRLIRIRIRLVAWE